MAWLWNIVSLLGGGKPATTKAAVATTSSAVVNVQRFREATSHDRRPKSHVHFSPSTIKRDVDRQMEKLASTSPFLNFLMEYNIKVNNFDLNVDGLSFHDIGRLSTPAKCLWQGMSDEEKKPYNELAQRVRNRMNMIFSGKRAMDILEDRTRLEQFGKVWLYDWHIVNEEEINDAPQPGVNLHGTSSSSSLQQQTNQSAVTVKLDQNKQKQQNSYEGPYHQTNQFVRYINEKAQIKDDMGLYIIYNKMF